MKNDRDKRLAATCPVEVRHASGVLSATTTDVTRHGLYVPTAEAVGAGTKAAVTVTLPNRSQVSFSAHVAHVLDEPTARMVGRSPGIGLEMDGAPPAGWLDFVASLEQGMSGPIEDEPLAIVILDRSEPLRERLVNNLNTAGFDARAEESLAAAVKACRDRVPDILLADTQAQGSNPLLVLKLLSSEPSLSDVAVVLMGEDADATLRAQAFRRGVRDFIPKPFTDEELMIRLRRVGPREGRAGRHVSLRGVLDDIGVPTVLSLLEYEKKPGSLVLARESVVGKIFVSGGRVMRAELEGAPDSMQALSTLLTWRHGSFAFLPGPVSGPEDVGTAISALLLEFARVSDEGSRQE